MGERAATLRVLAGALVLALVCSVAAQEDAEVEPDSAAIEAIDESEDEDEASEEDDASGASASDESASDGVSDDEVEAQDDDEEDDEAMRPLAHSISPWWAVGIGALGSLAYLLAAFVGFIGHDEQARARILAYFKGFGGAFLRPITSLLTVASFGLIGGGVAMIFQLTEHYLVPVQAFILGCTWPAVVANYLSARQQGTDSAIEGEVAREMRKVEKIDAEESVLEQLPESVPNADAAKTELEELLANL